MHILVIDNYDSFTFNLVHYIEEHGVEVTVLRNDRLDGLNLDLYDAFVISPGPSLPRDSGDLMKWLPQIIATDKPLLAVCLGLQAITEYFGGSLFNLKTVRHGIARTMDVIRESSLFVGLGKSLEVGLYHSWAVRVEEVPRSMHVTAVDEENVVMAMDHSDKPITCVQFHPESILTPHGRDMMHNWINSLGR